MSYQRVERKGAAAPADPLERGRFADGGHRFTVCASSAVVPDSFQVYADGNRADLVVIVSGLNTGDLHATWGDEWRSRSAAWKEWARSTAFHVFYNGSHSDPGAARFCDG